MSPCLLGRVGLDLMPATPTPNDQTNTRCSGTAQRHRWTWRRFFPPFSARRVGSAWWSPAMVLFASLDELVALSRDPSQPPPLSSAAGLGDRPRREQTADQFGASAETLVLSGVQSVVGQFRFNPLQHSRQCHRERDERLVQIRGGHFRVPVIGFRGHSPRAARAPGARNASQGARASFPHGCSIRRTPGPKSGHDKVARFGGGSRL
jgi:hypothetical protein